MVRRPFLHHPLACQPFLHHPPAFQQAQAQAQAQAQIFSDVTGCQNAPTAATVVQLVVPRGARTGGVSLENQWHGCHALDARVARILRAAQASFGYEGVLMRME